MKKRYLILIVILSIFIILLILQIYMMQSAKTEYTKKYNNCLEQEKISDLLGEYSLICESTK